MIRPMVRDDKEGVMNIVRRTALFTPQEAAVAEEVIDAFLDRPEAGDYEAVVFQNGERGPAGYAVFGPTPLTEGTYDLYWIAVAPERRSSGIGRRLMAFVEERLRGKGARMLLVETSSQPRYKPTRGFYLALGYKEAARIAGFYKPGDDRVTYAKYFG
ncbi:MAG: GNAT family N-acetyltransferase [Candidatus Aminicenantes bacterium]|nr:GNAT family N-acetyltransferase [Candidatus Aminicenantes bacterium]